MFRGALRMNKAGRGFSSRALRDKMEQKIVERQAQLKEFNKEHKDTVIGQVTVGQVIGGMRGLPGMVYETSKLHPVDGINYRGLDLYQIRDQAPKTVAGGQPIPEGILWLLLTGELPNESEMKDFSADIFKRGELSAEEEKMIKSLPKDMHPMTQLSAGVLMCQPQSKFAKAYQDGIHKSKYWEPTMEDALDLCAKVSRIAAIIYNNAYGGDLPARDGALDYGANYANQLGFTDPEFWELMRLYITIHADHEGGNVSAHATHLVGSALSDPYLSFSAGMNGLAGPLHGLANQECLNYILGFIAEYGENWNHDDVAAHMHNTLKSGKVIPGYGHAVLRKTDPRFMCELEFAEQFIKGSNLIEVVKANYEVIPRELGSLGKVANPFPNVDAGSGALLMHYGLTQTDYYTVLFGVSRAFGVAPAQVWSRALGLPIERPNSFTLDHLMDKAKNM